MAVTLAVLGLDEIAARDRACSIGVSGDRCPPGFDQRPYVDRADTFYGAAWGMGGLALAGLGVGLALVLVDAAAGDAPLQGEARLEPSIEVGPDRAYVALTLRF